MNKKNKNTSKKEVKRPENKKPRPKKHVESKTPKLPPMSLAKETKKDSKRIISFELPEGITEQKFIELINLAVKELKPIAESRKLSLSNLQHIFNEEPVQSLSKEELEQLHEQVLKLIKFKTDKSKKTFEEDLLSKDVVAPSELQTETIDTIDPLTINLAEKEDKSDLTKLEQDILNELEKAKAVPENIIEHGCLSSVVSASSTPLDEKAEIIRRPDKKINQKWYYWFLRFFRWK